MGLQQVPSVYVVDPYHDAAIEKLKRHPNIRLVLPGDSEKQNFLQQATAVLIRSETRLDAATIQKAHSGLKFIIKQGVGMDNVDTEAARQKGIKVFNTPGLNSEAVAELAMSLVMCVARRVCEFDRKIRNGEPVVRSKMLGKSLSRKSLGVVGMGHIGLEMARKWRGAMNGSIVAYDPYAKEGAWTEAFPAESFQRVESLEDLLRASDVVTLHVPLTGSTRNLLSRPQFAQMRSGAILINCARGGIVDEEALLEALDSGHLYGAGLDAVQIEPPTASAYGQTLLKHANVVMTPHAGASTAENQERSGLAAVDILFALLEDSKDAPSPVNA